MELIDGATLDKVLGSGALPVDRVIDIAINVADALDAAHSEGILHRDIKPGNIFITKRGQVKVVDFGLAKMMPHRSGLMPMDVTIAEQHALTSAGMAVGTVAYMSPEHARGEAIDQRSDLFSLGVVMYEMATGVQTFKGQTTAVIFDQILNRVPVPPSTINPDVIPYARAHHRPAARKGSRAPLPVGARRPGGSAAAAPRSGRQARRHDGRGPDLAPGDVGPVRERPQRLDRCRQRADVRRRRRAGAGPRRVGDRLEPAAPAAASPRRSTARRRDRAVDRRERDCRAAPARDGDLSGEVSPRRRPSWCRRQGRPPVAPPAPPSAASPPGAGVGRAGRRRVAGRVRDGPRLCAQRPGRRDGARDGAPCGGGTRRRVGGRVGRSAVGAGELDQHAGAGPRPGRGGRGLLVAGAAAATLALAGGGLWWMLQDREVPVSGDTPRRAAPTAPTPAPAAPVPPPAAAPRRPPAPGAPAPTVKPNATAPAATATARATTPGAAQPGGTAPVAAPRRRPRPRVRRPRRCWPRRRRCCRKRRACSRPAPKRTGSPRSRRSAPRSAARRRRATGRCSRPARTIRRSATPTPPRRGSTRRATASAAKPSAKASSRPPTARPASARPTAMASPAAPSARSSIAIRPASARCGRCR